MILRMANDALMDTIYDDGTKAAGGVCNCTLDFVTEVLLLRERDSLTT